MLVSFKRRYIINWWNKRSFRTQKAIGIAFICCVCLGLTVGLFKFAASERNTSTTTIETVPTVNNPTETVPTVNNPSFAG